MIETLDRPGRQLDLLHRHRRRRSVAAGLELRQPDGRGLRVAAPKQRREQERRPRGQRPDHRDRGRQRLHRCGGRQRAAGQLWRRPAHRMSDPLPLFDIMFGESMNGPTLQGSIQCVGLPLGLDPTIAREVHAPAIATRPRPSWSRTAPAQSSCTSAGAGRARSRRSASAQAYHRPWCGSPPGAATRARST